MSLSSSSISGIGLDAHASVDRMHSRNQQMENLSKALALHHALSKKSPWQLLLSLFHDVKQTSQGQGLGAGVVGASVGAAVVGTAVGAAVVGASVGAAVVGAAVGA